jgi:F420-non-reducing hydrogenase large subunit
VLDHATHFFALAGPDLFLGPDAPTEKRTFLGVLETLGHDLGQRIIDARMRNVAVIERLGGRGIHPDAALPGGWSCPVEAETRQLCEAAARANVEFARECLELHRGLLRDGGVYPDMLADPSFSDHTCCMGTVDSENRPNFFDGDIRVVAADGHEIVRFDPAEYRRHIAEHVEPWTRLKLPYLREFGWTGLEGSGPSGIYCATPLARLNVAEGMATPAAQEAYEELRATLGEVGEDRRPLPIHNRMANHWARLIELLHAAERMLELATDPQLEDRHIRVTEGDANGLGVGSVEAPRGTLFHEYHADDDGLLTRVDLVVGTTNNHAPMARSLTAAARALIRPGVRPTETLLQRIEMVLRSYDPCLSCATHAISGGPSFAITIRDAHGRAIDRLPRG